MARAGFIRRHKVAVASNTALVLAAGAVLAYAMAADGYQAHEAELNDGGIWVVHGDRGFTGRINKPINQLDTVIFSDSGDRTLDVVQDGAAVAAIDRQAASAQVIDPAASKLDTSGKISIPAVGDQQMGGGTFASIDAETGDVWVVRLDPKLGRPLITSVDANSKAKTSVGKEAALAVTQAGTVVATSADEGTITYLVPDGDDFAKARPEDLPAQAGAPSSVTAVGEKIVTLDAATGELAVIGGGTSTVPVDSVLQQAGPAAESVLVATPASLLRVDLESGEQTVVDEGRSGIPIEPVRLGACSYAAWSGGQGTVTTQCGTDAAQPEGLGGKASDLAFRVNRGQIVLNDNTSGRVWDLDTQVPKKIDNWNAFTQSKKEKDEDKKNEELSAGDRTPPEAKPDDYGARAGRTTVLHPLDNDSAPEGRLLSIIDVDQPGGGASAVISPDGQTIILRLPEKARSTAFDYYIDDGRSNATAHATVSIGVRGSNENGEPALRTGYEPRKWRTAAGGSITAPVLSDWRDDTDGDTLVLESASVVGAGDSGASARITSDGRLRFTGSTEGDETFQVDYLVSDGRSAPVKETMAFEVQGRRDLTAFSAQAEPDVVRGEKDQPIKIRPLLNDLPGSDPGTENAELTLGGKIPGQNGATIKTDQETGVITFTGLEARTYFIEYDAAFGNAALDSQTIRIDVLPRPNEPGDPVAMPDALTVFGQTAGIVDVLTNDLDPAGGLLAVQSAEADDPNQVDVAVIDGRWLRISARRGNLSPNPQLVHYKISNGSISGIEGEVAVSQRQTPDDNTPVTTTDRVHVRAGSAATAPVLDNDISPSGDRLMLVPDAAADVPGQLKITRPIDVKGDLGTAIVAGRTVRYIAPDLKERDTFTVNYIARSSAGDTSPGRLVVIITPADEPNTPPEPPTLEARVVSGASVKVRLPGSGIDPEGDPVTVTGITSAPRLGRVLSSGGNFLDYQAYPGVSGTDEFEYSVADSQGAIATGTVRVAVVPQGDPPLPLAVDDQLTVEPGRIAVFDPLANDYINPGDDITIGLPGDPEGVSVDPETNLVSVQAPDTTDGVSPPVVYSISNGIDSSLATLKINTADDFKNPPVVFDSFGTANDSDSVAVDVLEGAYDPDGSADDIRVTEIYGPGEINPAGDTIKVDRGPNPLVVAFRVEDADGAAATASLYVPPTGSAIPYVKPNALIELEEGGSAKGKLSDYIVNPSGGALRLTGRDSVSASPSDLQSTRSGDDGFEVSARGGYRGPGAVLLEVTTATDEAGNEDPQDPTDGYTALLSIPVQVGGNTPIVECPQLPISISAGDDLRLDIMSRCKVWTPDPADAANLDYEAGWTEQVEGLDFTGDGSPVFGVSADDDASRDGEATLSVTAGDSEPAEITFQLESAPPPRLLPIRDEELQAGKSVQINLAPYLESGVANPTPTVVSVDTVSGSGVTPDITGQSTVTLRAGQDAQGKFSFRVVMSDVDDSTEGSSRRVEGLIEVEVSGPPGVPGTPRSYPIVEKGTIGLYWDPPKDTGGLPITGYLVKERKGDTKMCRTNECDFPGLEERTSYSFRVAAINKAGQSEFSAPSQTAYADTKPGRVSNIRMTARGDHTVTLGWTKPASTTKIENYRISFQGQPAVVVSGASPTFTATNLDNNVKYFFSITAENTVGYGQARESPPFQSIGTPAPPADLAVVDRQSGAQATSVTAAWTATAPEGPAPTLYTLTYSAEGGPVTTVPGCSRIQSTTCTHTGVPYTGETYSYTVRAHNVEKTSNFSNPAIFEAIGKPAEWAAISVTPTGVDNQVRVTGTAPASRGSVSRAAILVNGGVAWEAAVPEGAVINELVNTPGNGTSYPVQLRMCNEKAAAVGCSFSDPKAVQSFGPLTGQLSQVNPEVAGLNVTWTISGTSNGDAAVVAISIDNGPEDVVPLGGPGAFQFTRSVAVTDYNKRTSIQVRLFDDNPGNRGQAIVSGQVDSGNPPLPTVSIYKRASCDDDNVDAEGNPITGDDCGAGAGVLGCTAASCGFMGIEVLGARAQFDCGITRVSDNNYSRQTYRNQTQSVINTDWVFDDESIEVTCTGGQGNDYFRVSTSMEWPR